jgi:SpoVK/Ycf46/Vps4 family AAA+-type ATPase
LDEIEKGLSGSQSSGQTDGGTSARVFGSFLSWMQEKTAPVFVIATANDVCKLPPEFLRKGRFDELFWVDLPTLAEREAIWAIQIQRHHREPKKFDLTALAKATEGWTGAEIEQGFVDALYEAFAQGQEPGMLTVGMALDKTMPLSKTMAEQIGNLRNWAKGRARPASSTPVETKGRKLAA